MATITYAACGKVRNLTKQDVISRFNLDPIEPYCIILADGAKAIILVRQGLVIGNRIVSQLPDSSACSLDARTQFETTNQELSEGCLVRIIVSWEEIKRFMDASKAIGASLHVDVVKM